MDALVAPVDASPILVRGGVHERLHIRYRIGSRTVDDGRCGMDNNWVELPWGALDNVDTTALCRYCFPPNVTATAGVAQGSGAME